MPSSRFWYLPVLQNAMGEKRLPDFRFHDLRSHNTLTQTAIMAVWVFVFCMKL